MVHRLTAILSGDEEIYLGEYENFYDAIHIAEIENIKHMVFRICEGENCIVGTRMAPGVQEVFWRIPREINRGRDNKVVSLLEAVISKFKKD